MGSVRLPQLKYCQSQCLSWLNVSESHCFLPLQTSSLLHNTEPTLAVLSAVVCTKHAILLPMQCPEDARGSQLCVSAAVRFSWHPPFAPG